MPRISSLIETSVVAAYLRRRSLALDARRLDDRPPFLNLGPVQRAKILRRLLLAGRNFLPKLAQPRLRGRVGERLDDGGVELGDDVLGRALRRPQGKPDRAVDSRHPRFV